MKIEVQVITACSTKSRKINLFPDSEALCRKAASPTSSGDTVDLSCATFGATNAVTQEEYDRVLRFAERIGIERGFRQEGTSASESFIPEFDERGL